MRLGHAVAAHGAVDGIALGFHRCAQLVFHHGPQAIFLAHAIDQGLDGRVALALGMRIAHRKADQAAACGQGRQDVVQLAVRIDPDRRFVRASVALETQPHAGAERPGHGVFHQQDRGFVLGDDAAGQQGCEQGSDGKRERGSGHGRRTPDSFKWLRRVCIIGAMSSTLQQAIVPRDHTIPARLSAWMSAIRKTPPMDLFLATMRTGIQAFQQRFIAFSLRRFVYCPGPQETRSPNAPMLGVCT